MLSLLLYLTPHPQFLANIAQHLPYVEAPVADKLCAIPCKMDLHISSFTPAEIDKQAEAA